jgi:hypothetical protein
MTHPTDFSTGSWRTGGSSMSQDHLTNGKRAALALDAINAYSRSRTEECTDEDHFFDYEREADPSLGQDQLCALLCGLMHYADYRTLSFNNAFRSARRDYQYQRQRTAYLPGDAVRRIDHTLPETAADVIARIGEIIKVRPGSPPSYQVDFMSRCEWLAESFLASAPHFRTISTGFGDLSSAHVARQCLNRLVSEIEDDYVEDFRPAEEAIRDLQIILGALSSWCGIPRPALLKSFSEVITEIEGWLVAGARSAHPVSLAAVDVPVLQLRPARRFRKDGR